jgi:hypothetical protein
MELKELLRALADGKGKLKITGFPKETIVPIKGMSAVKMADMIKNFDCVSLYEEPELTPQDICGYVWENEEGSTYMFSYFSGSKKYSDYNMGNWYTAKEIQEQFTRWE